VRSEYRNLKILVADDEEAFTNLMSDVLKKMLYDVRTANSGSEALAAEYESPADILITDINMPDMSGLDLTEQVLQIHPDTIIIAMTGHGRIADAVDFMKSGGFDYLQKPVSMVAVKLAIESAVNRWHLKEELRQAEQRYHSLFENAPVGIYQSSAEGKFICVNPAMARIVGYASAEELISGVTDIGSQLYLDPDDRKVFLGKLLSHKGWLSVEKQFFCKNKTVITAIVTARIVRNDEDMPLYIEGFIEDITERKKQEESFRLEMARAKEIYERLLQPGLPAMRGVGIYVKCLPAKTIGGDVAEILELDEKTLLIFLADVTGHGIPAAMTANTLKMLFREIAESNSDPAEICGHLSKTMYKTILPDDIIAAFCARIDLNSMMLTYCLCGVPSPVIIRKHERLFLEPTGFPIGVFEDAAYRNNSLRLLKEDILVAFTDGITEALSETGEIFGSHGVKLGIGEGEESKHKAVDSIFEEVIRFQGTDEDFKDDIIILAVTLFEEDDSCSVKAWNHFCEPDRCFLKIKSRYVDVDRVSNFIIKHSAEKLKISSDCLEKLKVAFFELLTNAMEHGNLEMTALKKNPEFYDSKDYLKIYLQRQKTEPYSERLIQIESLYRAGHLEISIEDEGRGFDLDCISDPTDTDNISRLTGRGIYIAKMSADQMAYNTKGNKVILSKRITKQI